MKQQEAPKGWDKKPVKASNVAIYLSIIHASGGGTHVHCTRGLLLPECAVSARNLQRSLTHAPPRDFSLTTTADVRKDDATRDAFVLRWFHIFPQSVSIVTQILTTENYDAVVSDKNKDVLVLIYAPWCGKSS